MVCLRVGLTFPVCALAAPAAAGAAPAANDNANRGVFSRLFGCCFAPRGPATVELANRAPGPSESLLPPLAPEDRGKKCLVLDLDETLVHSSFKPVANADFIIPVEIDDQVYQVYVLKRPRVDDFMKAVGEKFEVGYLLINGCANSNVVIGRW
jgi:hypothetical protein